MQVDKINGLEGKMQQLSDEELKNKTQELKQHLKKGANLDEILVEAFAVNFSRKIAKQNLDIVLSLDSQAFCSKQL